MPVDLIILGAIALFVALRLRSVLGQKIGHDQPPKLKDVTPSDAGRVIQLPPLREADAGDPDVQIIPPEEEGPWSDEVKEGIKALRAVDTHFSMRDFLEGAKGAFEMVVEAYEKNNRDALKELLSKELFSSFAAELDKQGAAESKMETTLVSILSATPTETALEKHHARVTVRFQSEQIHLRRDKKGAVVEGNASDIHVMDDAWTFARDLKSPNPNWVIVGT